MAGTFSDDVAVSASAVLGASEMNHLILATRGVAGITLTLPDNATYHNTYTCIWLVDAAAGVMTLDTSGSDTINGLASVTLINQGEFVHLFSNGAGLWEATFGTRLLTAGSVVFTGANGLPAQDNATLFWDESIDQLRLGGAFSSGMITVDRETDSNPTGIDIYVAATANTTTVQGLTIAADVQNDADLTNLTGISLSVSNPGAGTVTNAYGIKIEDVTGGSTNYAIKTGTGLVDLHDATTITVDDANETSVTTVQTLRHTTSGTPSTGLGLKQLFQLESPTSNPLNVVEIEVLLDDPTENIETSEMIFRTLHEGDMKDSLRLAHGTTNQFYSDTALNSATGDSPHLIFQSPGAGEDPYIYKDNGTNDLYLAFNSGVTEQVKIINEGSGVCDLSIDGKIATYDNIVTVNRGVPAQVATVDLTAQTAAKGATALYTPTTTGMYRASYYAKVTTVASVSSILGGTSGLVLAFTDGTDSVAQTAFTLPETDQAGNSIAIATGNTTNTTQATLTGSAVFFAKTGVGITYAFGYQSTNAAEMAYELHLILERF